MSVLETFARKVRPAGSGAKGSAPAAGSVTADYKPSALLVPAKVLDNRAKASAARTLVLGAGGLLAAAGLITGGLLVATTASNAQLDDVQTDVDALGVRTSALAPVGSFYKGFAARQSAVGQQLVSDVDYASVLSQITAAIPEGASVTSLTTDFGTTCPGPDPYQEAPGLGCVTLTASAPGLDSAGQFVRNIESIPEDQRVAIDPYVTRNESSSTSGEEGVTEFTSTINFASTALSSRFADLLPRTNESDTLDTTGPSPEAAPEAAATNQEPTP